MTYAELLSTYQKTLRVIRSCKTISQLNVSRKYAELFMKTVPPVYISKVSGNLTQLLRNKKRILWH